MIRLRLLVASALVTTSASWVQAASYEIAVIPKGTTQEYWRSVFAGSVKAQRELRAGGTDVEILWKGPLLEDDREQQIQIVENFVGRRVSAIVLAPLDALALVPPVEDAVKAGIPVVIIDSALRSKAPASTVATDNLEGGRLGARRLGTLLQGQGGVVMIRHQAGSASTEARETGFLEVMRSEFPGIRLVSTDQYGGATRETAFSVAQDLLNRFGSRVDGVFAPDEATACGTLLALREQGLNRKIRFVAFDVNEQLIGALREKEIEGLVVQDPFQMGYLGLMTSIAALRHQVVSPAIKTSLALVTPTDMDEPAHAALLRPPLANYKN